MYMYCMRYLRCSLILSVLCLYSPHQFYILYIHTWTFYYGSSYKNIVQNTKYNKMFTLLSSLVWVERMFFVVRIGWQREERENEREWVGEVEEEKRRKKPYSIIFHCNFFFVIYFYGFMLSFVSLFSTTFPHFPSSTLTLASTLTFSLLLRLHLKVK